jgi:hypothetical protein
MPLFPVKLCNIACPDFEEMIKQGIDAIELINENLLETWDCQSILIMNPDIIIPE